MLFYLTAYAFMTLGVFGVIIVLSTPERPVETVDDLSGTGADASGTAFGYDDLPVQPGGHSSAGGILGKFELFASAFGGCRAKTAISIGGSR